jgi:hypothetical protein
LRCTLPGLGAQPLFLPLYFRLLLVLLREGGQALEGAGLDGLRSLLCLEGRHRRLAKYLKS